MNPNDRTIFEKIKSACVNSAADNIRVRDFFAELRDSNYIGEAKGVAVEYGGSDIDLSEYDNMIRMLAEIVAYADARLGGVANV